MDPQQIVEGANKLAEHAQSLADSAKALAAQAVELAQNGAQHHDFVGFFTVFVIMMSLIQGGLERRKDARKAAHASLGDGRWRGGW